MTRDSRETGRIRWPRNATERAILIVIAGWHYAEIQKLLREAA